MPELAYCGLDCAKCDCRTQKGCPGCQAAAGKMFWGDCALAKCCIDRQVKNCGYCPDLPCEELKAFAYHKVHGDNGRRIANLREIGPA